MQEPKAKLRIVLTRGAIFFGADDITADEIAYLRERFQATLVRGAESVVQIIPLHRSDFDITDLLGRGDR